MKRSLEIDDDNNNQAISTTIHTEEENQNVIHSSETQNNLTNGKNNPFQDILFADGHVNEGGDVNNNANGNKAKRQRKYRALSIQQKKEVIDLIDKKKSYEEISKIYGVSSGTISNIKENRKVIDSIIENNKLNPNMKQIKPRMKKESQILDEKLFLWLNAARERNYPVSGPKLIEKAKIISDSIGLEFKGSNGWLESFKKRHNISFRNILPVERHPDIPPLDHADNELKDWETEILLGESHNDESSDSASDDENAEKNPKTKSKKTTTQVPNVQKAATGLATFLIFISKNDDVRETLGITPEILESMQGIRAEMSKMK
jgi:hypothetical protein